MLTVEETEKLVLNEAVDYGNEIIPFDMALGRILAETINVGNAVISPGDRITPIIISSLVSAGELEVRVKRLPKVVVLSSDNLTDIINQPVKQLKSPQGYLLQATLKEQGIESAVLSFPPEVDSAKNLLQQCLYNFDVILATEGANKLISSAYNELSVNKLVHHIQDAQLDGLFWLGKHENGTLMFVFRGDAEITLTNFNHYFIPWLNLSLKVAVY